MALLLLLDPNYQFIRANIQSSSEFSTTLQVLRPINVELVSSGSSVLCSTSILRNPQSILTSISTLDSSVQVDHQILTNIIGVGEASSYVEVNHEIRSVTSSSSSTLVTTYIAVDTHSNLTGTGSLDSIASVTKELRSDTQGSGVANAAMENRIQLLTNLVGQGQAESVTSINKALNSLIIGFPDLSGKAEVTKELRVSDTASGSCQASMDIVPPAQYVYLNAQCIASSSMDSNANILKDMRCLMNSTSSQETSVSISHEIRSASSSTNSSISWGFGISKSLNTLIVGAGSVVSRVTVVGEPPYKLFIKSSRIGPSNVVVYDKYEKVTSHSGSLETKASKKEIIVTPFDKTEIA